MKRKILSIVTGISLLGSTFLGSGCGLINDWLIHKIPAPDGIEINGVTYVTGFYREDTNTDGAERENKSEPVLEKDYYQFWKLANSKYDLYGCIHSHQMSWNHPQIYCREDQVEEVKAYYESVYNADYYFNVDFDFVELPEDVNKAYLNEAVEYAYAVCENEKYDPFESRGFKRIEVVLSEISYKNVYVVKVSEDGIFTSPSRTGYYYIDGNLYARKRVTMPVEDLFKEDGLENYRSQPDILYLLEGEAYDYILQLFKEYALNPES